MTRKELIDHLQHLEQYTHYSEDAPALREAIALLSQSYSTERAQERTETHACDLIDRREAIDATWFEPSYADPLNVLTEVRDRLKALPSAQLIDVREAYYRGKTDGIKECTARLKKMNEEFANG